MNLGIVFDLSPLKLGLDDLSLIVMLASTLRSACGLNYGETLAKQEILVFERLLTFLMDLLL